MEFNRSRVVIENKTNPKPILILILIFISFFFFLFLMVFILSSFCSSIMSSYNGDSDNTRSCSFGKSVQYSIIANCEDDHHQDQFMRLPRRGLGGPGSSPPRCASKCGKCTPCTAVHVPVPPGTPVTAEYYPEAWRCKCGNKLYMP
ncbi:EPIDERMAL PATTERNING FACTOR-like protein 6 [Cucumis sativus]|uniref:Epidermal patterning factor-like protein n=1 Tax=Cucumis sativus TaxID=3659 RepID=A0A0A0LXR9_CUCSA|nr:EPIDERMAL PATTERNING FACTOR-like protein 6 [Cucumis sativus]KGN65854.1 hypothetical protein Csa_023188 [Cucumis sativus]